VKEEDLASIFTTLLDSNAQFFSNNKNQNVYNKRTGKYGPFKEKNNKSVPEGDLMVDQ